MLTRRTLLAGLLLPVLSPVPSALAALQDDDEEVPSKSAYEQLFPKPTGQNGYEELILAGERLRGATAEYESAATFTLAKKRAYLADPACQEALSLLRQGLAKPIRSPEASGSAPDRFPSYAMFRAISRLLAVEIFVDFADGRNEHGIVAMTDGLMFSNVIKSESLISHMVGVAIDSVVMTTLLRMWESWSVRDCTHIMMLAEKLIALPDPAIQALGGERETAVRMIAKWKDAFVKDPSAVDSLPGEEEGSPGALQLREYLQSLQRDPNLRQHVFEELSYAVNLHFDRAMATLVHPERAVPLSDSENKLHPITQAIRGRLVLDIGTLTQKPVTSRILPKLLGIHAAIRRYRWENDRLPKTLAELRLSRSLTEDPFTGMPLEYTPNAEGTDYRLASAGPLISGDKGAQDKRQPVLFTRPRVK